MKKTLFALGLLSGVSTAATIVGSDTAGTVGAYTTADTLVTLTPYTEIGTPTVGSMNAGGFIGVNGGTNNNAVDDGDGLSTTLGDREALDLTFDPTVGFSRIAFAFSRADGPSSIDGITISGFTADPGVSVLDPVGAPFVDVRWDSGSGTVYAEISGAQFNGTDRTLVFSNHFASAGNTLRLTVTDTTQGAPQAAIRSISYEVVPEPSVALLGALGLLGLVRRRR